MNLDISTLGYRWRGIHSPYLSYRDGDVVFKEGGAWVIRHGQPQPFALGQQDAVLKGHLLTGGVSVGGFGGMVLHANEQGGIEFRFPQDRNGTVAVSLMQTLQDSGAHYMPSNYHMMAVMTDGSVRGWGRAVNGQLGEGSTADIYRTFPARAAFPSGTPRIVKVLANRANTYYIDAEGGLWFSGDNTGNLCSGDGITGAAQVPRRLNGRCDIGETTRIVDLFLGSDFYAYYQAMALDDQGRVYAWGHNRYNSLGLASSSNTNVATLVPFTQDVPIKAAYLNGAYYAASHLIDHDGNCWASGQSGAAFLGGDTPPRHLRLDLGGQRVKKVVSSELRNFDAAGAALDYRRVHGLITESGHLYVQHSTPDNTGMGTTAGYAQSLVDNPLLTGVADAYFANGGYLRGIALMQDGRVMGRGYSGYGFASDAGNTTTWLPIGGDHLTGVTKLRATAGRYGSLGLALRGDGRLVVWGRNELGLHGTGVATEGPASGFVLSERPLIDFSLSGYVGYGAGDVNAAVHALNDRGQVLSWGAGNQCGDDDGDHCFSPSVIRF